MIRKFLMTVSVLGAVVLLSSSMMDDNGKAGRTNAPGETTCVNSCHNSYALNSGPGSITIQNGGMTNNAYVPGQTYHMSVTVAQSGIGLFGVGIEALTTSSTNAGSLRITDSASTRIKTATVSGVSRINITHALNGGVSSGSKVFQFDWIAPAAGTGNVTFFFSGVAANGNGDNNLDYVYNSNAIFTEACNPPAQPGSISGNASVCEGSTEVYSVAPVAGATSYTWTLPQGWGGGSVSETMNATAGSSSGDITVTANSSCGASSVTTFTVTVNPLPVPVVSLVAGSADTLTSTPASSYQWYLNSNSISGAVYQTYVPSQNGNYSVEVTDATGCQGTSTAYSFTTTGIDNVTDNLISVYPNPSSDFISVNAPSTFENDELSIYDLTGHKILQTAMHNGKNNVDVHDLSEGMYYAVVNHLQQKMVSKFVVKK